MQIAIFILRTMFIKFYSHFGRSWSRSRTFEREGYADSVSLSDKENSTRKHRSRRRGLLNRVMSHQSTSAAARSGSAGDNMKNDTKSIAVKFIIHV